MSSGIAELSKAAFSTVDPVLATCMIERWQPETNSFHLPFGEMTITLDDVKQILKLPVTGKAIVATKSFGTIAARDLLVQGLRISECEAEEMLQGSSVVPLAWLHERFSGTKNHVDTKANTGGTSDKGVEAALVAYHLFVLGCTGLTDKSGTCVSVQYLQYLWNLEDIPNHNWGSALLAYLYRQLSIGSIYNTKQTGGCHTLLQVLC